MSQKSSFLHAAFTVETLGKHVNSRKNTYSVFRITYSIFFIPCSIFRMSHSIFRIPCFKDSPSGVGLVWTEGSY